jgi:PAS domain S-box-containing protein
MINSLVSAFTINIYGILAVLSALLALSIAIIAFGRTKTLGGRSLGLINVSVATWSTFAALNYLSVALALKIWWLKLSYLGILSLPVFLLLIALEYNGSIGWWLNWKRIGMLFIIPLISFLMGLSNEWHHLVYAEISASPFGPFLHVSFGWYFWVGVAGYSYLLILSCVLILTQVAWQNVSIYRRQIMLLLFSIFVPVFGNVLFLLRLLPIYMDPTSILFSITCALFALGIFRFRLLDLVPVALHQVVESLGDVILVVDVLDRLVYINPAAAIILGQERAKLIGQPVTQALPALVDRQARSAGPRSSFSLVNSGSLRHYSVEISPLHEPGQIPGGQVVVLHDITLLKQAQETFQRAAISEERERMAQELHDHLGQVLGYLQLNTQSIRDQIEQGSYTAALGQLQSLSLIAQSASQDVHQFILDSNTQAADVRSFSGVVKDYLQRFETITGLRVRLSLPDESIDALLSQESYFSLLRIIQEALTNARKHARASLVQIIFSVEEHALAVVISDDGIGFENQPEQDGFGLEIIRKRAQQVGADVVIRSAKQQGTQVLLKFPRLWQQSTNHELLGLRVLVVDDHPLFAEGISKSLASRGLDVAGIARDGDEALRLADELKPDLVLLDVPLPNQSGPQLIQAIKENCPAAQVVIFSLNADDEALVESMGAGANGFLLKNQPTEEFFQALAAIRRGETQLAPGLANQLARRLRSIEAGQPRREQAIQALQAAGLSSQQIDILALVAQGKIYKEIATELKLSESAIKYHSDRIQSLLNLPNRAELVAYAIKTGLAPNRRSAPEKPA